MEYVYELKIPKDRIAVLIGKCGKIKKEIEESTNSKLNINSIEGDVFITGEDGLGICTAMDVIKAIGRGFNPDTALLLLKPDYGLEVINLTDHVGKSRNHMIRIKGRVIGESGKSRRIIEMATETFISVYGKTIAIIGETHKIAIARKAIGLLLSGSPHSSVYRWLERKAKELKREEMI